MADDMSIDKKELSREGSEDSMDLNSPTPEADPGAPPETAGVSQQKRKGGRKPVRSYYCKYTEQLDLLIGGCYRYTQLPRNGNSVIGKRKQPLGNAEQSTSSN